MTSYKVFKGASAVNKSVEQLINAKFSPNYFEWIQNVGQLVSANVRLQVAGSASNEFYTVPQGKMLYVFSAGLSMYFDAGILASGFAKLRVLSDNKIIVSIILPAVAGAHDSKNIFCSIPIRVNEGDSLTAIREQSAHSDALFYFWGYLVDKNLAYF